jgi:hypothetical protein
MSNLRMKTALAALAVLTMTGGMLSMTAPASADDRSDYRPWRHHHHHRWDRSYYPRDYVYVAPGYTYYAPPPTYYYSTPAPGFSLNFNID